MVVRLHNSDVLFDRNPWEWSGPLDISMPKTYNFVIRPRSPANNSSTDRAIDISMDNSQIFFKEGVEEKPKFMKAEISKLRGVLYISLSISEEEKVAYRVQNDTRSFVICYRQHQSEPDRMLNPEVMLMKACSTPFAWPFPSEKTLLEVTFKCTSGEKFKHPSDLAKKYTFNMDKINEQKKIAFRARAKLILIHAKIEIHGWTRTLRFTEESRSFDTIGPLGGVNHSDNEAVDFVNPSNIFLSKRMSHDPKKNLTSSIVANSSLEKMARSIELNDIIAKKLAEEQEASNNGDYSHDYIIGERDSEDHIDRMIILLIKNIGISVITTMPYSKKKIELNYLSFQNVEFAWIEQKEYKTVHLRVKYLNVDNNTEFHSLFPVNITPSLKQDIQDNRNKYFFDVCVKYNHNSEEVNFIFIIIKSIFRANKILFLVCNYVMLSKFFFFFFFLFINNFLKNFL
jgi:hypothetical protein